MSLSAPLRRPRLLCLLALLGAATGLPSVRAQIFVADNGAGTTGGVSVFAQGANGNVLPDMTLIGANTGINANTIGPIWGVVANSTDVYVLCGDNRNLNPAFFVLKYSRPTSGNAAPATTSYITLSAGNLGFATALAIDGTNLYVLDNGTGGSALGAVNVYALSGFTTSHSSGSPLAVTTSIAGATNTGFNRPNGMAVASGFIYVANTLGNNLLKFATSANGDVAPTSTITGLNGPVGVAVDASNIYVLNGGTSGSPTPTVTTYDLAGVAAKTIGSTSFTPLGVFYLALDANNFYVGDFGDPLAGTPVPPSVYAFPKTTASSLTATPTAGTISGALALQSVAGLYVLTPPGTAAPTVTTSGGTTAFTAGGGAVAVDSAVVSVTAVPNKLATATIQITTPSFQTGQDVLAFNNNNATNFGNIAGSYNSTFGLLQLVSDGASATLAQWLAALRAVSYNDTSGSPNTGDRTVSLKIFDGAQTSSTALKTVSFAASTPTPLITSVSPSAGPANVVTVITLTGTNFGASSGHLTGASYGVAGGSSRISFTNQNTSAPPAIAWISATSAALTTGTDLAPGQAYNFTITVDGSDSLASSAQFTAYGPPSVTTPSQASVTATGATLGGTVAANNGAVLTERGVVYSVTTTNANPQISGTGVTKVPASGTGTGVFTTPVTGLSGSTGYTYRAYAINAGGTTYSSTDTFTTASATPTPTISSVNPTAGPANVATVITLIGTNFGANSGHLTGASYGVAGGSSRISFTNQNTSAPPAIVYNSQNQATLYTGTDLGPGQQFNFTITVDGSESGASSALFTAYGPPSVTTPSQASVTATGATLGGTVAANNGAVLTERGVVYSVTTTNANPQISGTGVTKVPASGTTTGVFTTAVTGLTGSTGYTYRAYAINAGGTSYSETDAFTTPAAIPTPVITNVSPSSGPANIPTVITLTGTNFGASSSHLSGASYGVVGASSRNRFTNQNTSAPPAIVYNAQNQATLYTGTDLASGQQYNFTITVDSVESSVSSAQFTAYSTPSVDPAPTHTAVTATSATLGGNVTADNGAALTEQGVIYSVALINANPLINGPSVFKVPASSTGTGVFTTAVTGLSASTGYTFRAYAINAGGTSYSVIDTFTTAAAPLVPTILSVSPTIGVAAHVARIITITGTNFGLTTGHLTAGSYALVGASTRTAASTTNWISSTSATLTTGTDLAPGQQYNFTVTVDGVESSPSSGSSALFTTLPTPTINIGGSSVISTTRPVALNLSATAVQTRQDGSVDISAPFGFTWSVSPQVALNSSASTQSLTVPANTLTPGVTYTFTLTAINLRDGPIASASVTVHVVPSSLTAAISGGAVRSVAYGQSLILDATSSFDPDSASTALGYSWTVTDHLNSPAVDQTTGQALTLAPTGTLVIPALKLAPGTYTATVTVRSTDGRTAPATVTFTVVAAPPAITSVSPSKGAPNVLTTLTLTGQNFGFSSSDLSSVTYSGQNTATTTLHALFATQNVAAPGFTYVNQNTVTVVTNADITPNETVNFTIMVDGAVSTSLPGATFQAILATPASLTLADATQTYTGNPIALTPGGVPTGATVTYSYSGTDTAGKTYTNVSGTPTNAGTYTVTGSLNSSLYSGTFSATATVTINAASAAITLADSSQTYTGSPIALPTAGGVPSAAHLIYTYTGTGGTHYGPSTTAPTAAGTYAVAARDPNYALTVTGPNHTGVTSTISGAKTGLSLTEGIAVDANHIYVANSLSTTITVYPLAAATASASYASAPSTTISGANTRLDGPFGVAVDANHIYVANSFSNTITIYPLTANGSYDSAPSTTISGASTGLNVPEGIAVDANHIYVANSGNSSVTVYPLAAATAGATYSSAPSTTIIGAATRLKAPQSIAVDASHIYVANAGINQGVNAGNTVTVYPLTATASTTYSTAPTTVISGGSASAFLPDGVAVDSSNIYVTDTAGLRVEAYPLTVTANSTYTYTSANLFATISDTAPQGIAADSSHIYVTNRDFNGVDSVAIYPAPGTAFLTIGKATPVIQWTPEADLNNGTLLAGKSVNLSGATVTVNSHPFTDGRPSYQPSSITMPAKATSVQVAVTFAPTDTADYATVTTTFTVPLNPISASSTQTISNARRPFNAPGGTVRTESEGISPLAVSSDGTVASNLSPDGKSGTLIGYLPSSGQGFAVSIAPDINGNFTATTTTVGGTNTPVSLTITGTATSAGVSGTIQPLGLSFSGTSDPAAGPTAALSGIYQSSTVNAASGTTYTIVGSQGEAFVLTVAPGLVAAGTGTVDPISGSLNVPLSSSASVTGTISASTGGVSGTVTTGTGGTLNFSGVANLVQATNPLINFSGLGTVTPASPLSFGFVVDGVVPKTVVLRGVGPGLAAFGVGKALAQPSITLYDSAGDLLGTNSAWGGTSDLTSAFAQVGAFALPPTSKDTALQATLQPGPYTVVLADAANDAGGQALAEVYDASIDSTEATQSLVNVSILGQVSATNTLVGGFVIQGNSPKQVLIRAVGPGLTSFGVASPLGSPALAVYTASGTVVAQNTKWGTPIGSTAAGASAISSAAASAGAFPLASGSADSAIVVTLAPGNYTAIVTGSAGAAGTALLEIYEIH